MNIKHVSTISAILSVVLVLCVAYWGSTSLTSPGPLAPAHADVSDFRGSKGCRVCHGDEQTRMHEACSACHEPISDQSTTGIGLHGQMESALFQQCDKCHFEHISGSIALISEQAFGLAGVPDVDNYDHKHAGAFALVDRHDELQCSQCHKHADDSTIAAGNQRYLGLSQDCIACHESPHERDLGVGCADCHGQSQPFALVAEFEHPDTFRLVDAHANINCTDCHGGTSFDHISTDCASCHTEDFNSTTDPDHALLKMSNDCASCHTIIDWRVADYDHTDEFPLLWSHADASCIDCHDQNVAQAALLANSAGNNNTRGCGACHDSQHSETLLAQSVLESGGDHPDNSCALCHSSSHQSFGLPDAEMTHDLHDLTGFTLGAPHETAECAQCHAGIGESYESASWEAAYPGRAQNDCQSCHEDPHLGQFLAGPSRGRCFECHLPQAFQPSRFDMAMHAEGEFLLTGSHRAVACVACHQIEDGMRVFAGTPSDCINCHADPHNGRFDALTPINNTESTIGCARCHTTESFNNVVWTAQEHERLAGYPLIDAHAEASCRDCHKRSLSQTNAAVLEPVSTACAACHTDTHQGQFRQEGVTDCARCHTSFASFAESAFDHETQSRFKLDGDHRLLDCVACHREYESDFGRVVRFKPLGIRCQDCHDPRSIEGGNTP